MKSVPPVDYMRLPRLARPSAYICVIRDVDSDQFRLQATAHPASLVEAILARRKGGFGIELLAILESDDIAASQARLYERHHATLSGDWLPFDAYQWRALKRSELRIDDYGSHYVSGGARASAAAAQSTARDLTAPSPASSGIDLSSPRSRSLSPPAESEPSRRGWRQSMDEAITDIWTRHPGKCMLALAVFALYCLASFDYSCPSPRGCPDLTPLAATPAPRSTATAVATTYTLESAATIRACPSLGCASLGLLSAGAVLDASDAVDTAGEGGKSVWIAIELGGKTAYVLAPSDSLKH